MASHRIGGVCYLKITHSGGTQQVEVRGSWKVVPGATKKEGIAGLDAVHGYKEMPVVPYMEGDITNGRDYDPRVIDKADDITATLELANGQVWVGVQGWRADLSELDAEEGKTGLKLEFTKIDMVASQAYAG